MAPPPRVPCMMQGDLFSLPGPVAPSAFVAYLNDGARHSASVTFTRNRVTMISVAFRPGGGARVRLHEAYLSAPPEVHRALRTYLRTRRKESWRTVAEYARAITVPQAAVPPRQSGLRTRGKVFDLAAIRDSVNREFFLKKIPCRIGWGRRRARRSKRGRTRSIRFGSWFAATRTILINPILDDARVSPEFVRYIVFHEMLHAVVPEVRRNGRRYDHSREFRALERSFPDVARMHRMSTELLDVLL